MITSIFEISCSTFCGSKYRLLGFVKGRFGVGNQFLMFLIGRLHVSRYIEKPFEEGRGEVLKLKFLFL